MADAQALLSRKARAPVSQPWTGFYRGLSGHHYCSLMRLQNILQSFLHCVVAVGVAGTMLGVVRGQVGARTHRLVLVVTSLDRVEDIQEVGRHRTGRQADELAERRMADRITVCRAGLQELRRVLEPEGTGRDRGIGIIGRAVVIGAVIGMTLARVAAVASVGIVAATVVAMVVVMIVIVIVVMITGLTAWAGRSSRARHSG
nr:hypothetical protein [Mesorhizobium norvegicum]